MEVLTVTIADACKATGIGKSKLYELIERGDLETAKVDGRRLVRADSLRRLVGIAA